MFKHRRLCTTALLCLSASLPVLAAQPDTQIVEANDAYHLKYWPNNSRLAAYTEWWYFNVVDASQNVQAVLVYFVTNPNETGGKIGIAPMLSVAYTPSGVTTKVDLYQPTSFTAAYNKADVTLGANQIQVVDPNIYHLTGASQDGILAWDLTYDRQANSFQGLDKAQLGKKPWEKVSWLAYMPRADVSGSLTVNGTVYAIKGTGYHDHNWGEWIPKDVPWNWAQFSRPGLWFDIYDFIGGTMGVARLHLQGQDIEFTKDQYKIVHTKWAYDKVNHVKYPVKTQFTANNGTQRFDMLMDAVQTDPLGLGLPYPKPEYLIYEQTAQYSGEVLQKDSSGKWQSLAQFKGEGFKEYTTERQ